jgi:predicted RNA-binding Zn ribbon-like protein
VDDSWRGYHLTGGHIALDLTNTVSWRDVPDRRFDRLDRPGFLAHWLRLTGLGEPAGDLATVLPAVRELRELVHALLTAQEPARTDLARFGRLLARAHTRATASTLPLRWAVLVTHVDDVVPALVLRSDELLRSADVTRVRGCAGPGCGWLFVDTTRNHSRRWCRTDDCGNRERARRHYRRTRQATIADDSSSPSKG